MIVFKINKNLNERLSIPWLMNAIFVSIIYATVFVVNSGIGSLVYLGSCVMIFLSVVITIYFPIVLFTFTHRLIWF